VTPGRGFLEYLLHLAGEDIVQFLDHSVVHGWQPIKGNAPQPAVYRIYTCSVAAPCTSRFLALASSHQRLSGQEHVAVMT
jgi:hypothetical protein